MKTLRLYQRDAVEILADGGLNGSGLGAGKTLISVEAVRRLKLGRPPRILVIAPVPVLGQWRATFVEQYPTLEAKDMVHIIGTHVTDQDGWTRLTKKHSGVFIMSWNAMQGGIPDEIRREASHGRNANRKAPEVTSNAVRKAISKGWVPPWTRTGTWDLVIIDEVHRAVNRKGTPNHVLKFIKATKKLALSATPGGNKPQGLWSVLNLLWPKKYTSFWDWVYEHFHVTEGFRPGAPEPVRTIGAERRPGGVWEGIPAAVRYRTEDVCDQLPPVIERAVNVPMGPEQEEQYRDFEKQSLAWLSDMPIATPLPIEQRIRLRQAALGTLKANEVAGRVSYKLSKAERVILEAWTAYCDSRPDVGTEDFIKAHNSNLEDGKRHLLTSGFHRILEKQHKLDQGIEFEEVALGLDIAYEEQAEQLKLDAVKEILADLPEGEPLLVWTHSAKWARMAEKALGSQAVSWTSSTTAAKRKKIETAFSAEWRVLIAQLQSLSEGVDWLKDTFRCEVIASPTEDEVMNQQVEGRLHRPGQKSPVQRWRLVTGGTIDDDVNLNNLTKRTRMGSLYKDDQRQAVS